MSLVLRLASAASSARKSVLSAITPDGLFNAMTIVGAGGTLAYAVYKDYPVQKKTDWFRYNGNDKRCQTYLYRFHCATAFVTGGIVGRYGTMAATFTAMSAAVLAGKFRRRHAFGLAGVIAAAAVGYEGGQLFKRWPQIQKQRMLKKQKIEADRLAADKQSKIDEVERLRIQLADLQQQIRADKKQ